MKKLLKIGLVLLMTFVLTGCIKMNVNVEVKEDLSISAGFEFLFSEDMISAYGNGMTTDQFLEQMKSQMKSESDSLNNVAFNNVSRTIDGKKYIGIESSKVEATAEEAKNAVKKETIDGEEKIVVTIPMEQLSENTDMGDLSSMGYSVDQMKALGVEMNMVIKMPGKAACNVGTVDGDTVTIDLLTLLANNSKEDIVITSSLSSGSNMMWIIGGVCVGALAGVAVYMFMKKKSKGTEEAPINETSEVIADNVVQEEVSVEEPVVEEPVETDETPTTDENQE